MWNQNPNFIYMSSYPEAQKRGSVTTYWKTKPQRKPFFMKSRCEQSEASSWIEHPLVGFTVWSYAIEVSWVKWSPLNSENIILYCRIHALLSLADSAKLARACSLVCDRISMFFVCGGMAAGGWVLERGRYIETERNSGSTVLSSCYVHNSMNIINIPITLTCIIFLLILIRLMDLTQHTHLLFLYLAYLMYLNYASLIFLYLSDLPNMLAYVT